MKIKAVIFNHNQRQTADVLFERLSTEFDTALFDSGSDTDQVSPHTTEAFENLYWTGCWNKACEIYSAYDVIWGLGGDCSLENPPEQYRQAIESAFPFGLWSPTVSGRAHDYMQPRLAIGRIFSVHYLEGMAFAISKELRDASAPFDARDYIGYSHDRRLSFVSRQLRLKNILDGRVTVNHPPSEKYDREEAKKLMEASLSASFGPDWADTLDWWPQRTVSFLGNAISEVIIADSTKRFLAPFHRK